MDSYRAFKANLYEQFAMIGKALSSPARLELLDLVGQTERSVEDLAFEAGLSVANASQHLQVLRQAGLVEVHREGKFSYYRLAGKEAFKTWQSIRDFAAVKVAEVQRLAEQYLNRCDELEALSIAELRRRLATGDVVLIDVRPELEYRAGHISGALSVPVEKLATVLRTLPHDKEIVAYCRGPFCLFSHEAVLKLKKKGLRHVGSTVVCQIGDLPVCQLRPACPNKSHAYVRIEQCARRKGNQPCPIIETLTQNSR